MSNKKLTTPEIRQEIFDIFNSNGEFYSMKELEVAGRNKGISQKNVKDMVQTLVGQNHVETAKIANIHYYWIIYKDEKILAKKEKLEELKELLMESEEKLKKLKFELAIKKQIEEVPVDIEEALKREQLTKELNDLKTTVQALEEELEDLTVKTSGETSEFEKIQNNMKPLANAVNRWTDNVFNCIEFTKKMLNVEDIKKIYKEFKIPENLDYI